MKIGCAFNMAERLGTLYTTMPMPMKLEAMIHVSDYRGAEAGMHERFAAQRSHGEWFRRCPEMDAVIEEHRPAAEAFVVRYYDWRRGVSEHWAGGNTSRHKRELRALAELHECLVEHAQGRDG